MPVRAELVEVPPFFCEPPGIEGRPFDKLRANGRERANSARALTFPRLGLDPIGFDQFPHMVGDHRLHPAWMAAAQVQYGFDRFHLQPRAREFEAAGADARH